MLKCFLRLVGISELVSLGIFCISTYTHFSSLAIIVWKKVLVWKAKAKKNYKSKVSRKMIFTIVCNILSSNWWSSGYDVRIPTPSTMVWFPSQTDFRWFMWVRFGFLWGLYKGFLREFERFSNPRNSGMHHWHVLTFFRWLRKNLKIWNLRFFQG